MGDESVGEFMKRDRFTQLQNLPNIGPAIAAKLRLINIQKPSDLMNRDPYALYAELNKRTGHRHDPCLLDVFIAVTRFMAGEPEKPWWAYTGERKAKMAGRAKASGCHTPNAAGPDAGGGDRQDHTSGKPS